MEKLWEKTVWESLETTFQFGILLKNEVSFELCPTWRITTWIHNLHFLPACGQSGTASSVVVSKSNSLSTSSASRTHEHVNPCSMPSNSISFTSFYASSFASPACLNSSRRFHTFSTFLCCDHLLTLQPSPRLRTLLPRWKHHLHQAINRWKKMKTKRNKGGGCTEVWHNLILSKGLTRIGNQVVI